MAHPNKSQSESAHAAKLRKMTAHYGAADPKANIASPQARLKQEGAEEAVGFGADSDKLSAKGDRSRRTTSANPVATYRKGGAVPGRARGGRSNKNKGTHVNVIVAPQAAPAAPPPVAGLAAGPGLPLGAPPPMPPKPLMGGAMPPPGGPQLPPPPGAMPPGAIAPRARGGRLPTQKHHMTAGAVTGIGRLEKIGVKPKSAGRPQTV